jgi:hypothetical protein
MEVQQDAVRYICESLSMPYLYPKELEFIRIIRNDAIGHAIKRKEGRVYKSNFIQRSNLGQNSFTLLTVFSDRRDYTQRQVRILELRSIQKIFIARKLAEIVEKLRRDEMAHRAKFKDEKLQDFLPDTLNYIFSKIFEMSSLSGPCLKDINVRLGKFRTALEVRNEWRDDDEIAYSFNLAQYPADELVKFFDAPHESKLNEKDAHIFISFLKT